MKDQTYSDWRKAHTNDDGSLDCSIFWWHFSRLIRCLPDALLKQLPITFFLIVGIISTPFALENLAGGFATKQVNYQQPGHGIILSQTGVAARQVFDVGSHVTGSTVTYISNTQAGTPQARPMPNNRPNNRPQLPTVQTSILGNGMGQY